MTSSNPPTRPAGVPDEVWDILTASEAAVSHHWVPRMILRNFSPQPNADDPEIWCKPTDGRPARASRVGTECTIRDHNTLANGSGLPPKAMEGTFARIESDAAPAIRKLLAGNTIGPDERRAITYLIAVQHSRTPRARAHLRHVVEESVRLQTLVNLHNRSGSLRDRARESLKKKGDPAPSDEAIDAWLDDVARAVEGRKVVLRAPHEVEVAMGGGGLPHLAPIIYCMSWIGARVTGKSSLVIGDHPLVFYDPDKPRDQPAAWLPPTAAKEVTFPLSPDFCLVLSHVQTLPAYQEITIDANRVRELNLRSMANAWRHFYGPNRESVEAAADLASRNPARIATLRPVPGGLIVGHRLEGAESPHKFDIFRAPTEFRVSRPGRRPTRTPR